MNMIYIALALIAIVLIAGTIYYEAYVKPTLPELSYDFTWQNSAQGTTYFCNQTKTSVTCSVMECYQMSGIGYSQNYCRPLGLPPFVFEKHD